MAGLFRIPEGFNREGSDSVLSDKQAEPPHTGYLVIRRWPAALVDSNARRTTRVAAVGLIGALVAFAGAGVAQQTLTSDVVPIRPLPPPRS